MRYSLPLAVALAFVFVPEATAQISSGTCTVTGSATSDLAVNNVRARLFNNGGLFWKGNNAVYNVPAVAEGQPLTPNAIFAAGIWVGGLVNGEPRIAATDYGPWEFYAGPLTASGALDDPTCTDPRYDRIYTVSRQDVADYDASSPASDDLRDWPTGLGAPTLAPAASDGLDNDGDGQTDEAGEMARVSVMDQPLAERKNRIIDLTAGERPDFTGDQMAWWVMNDVGGAHGSTGSAPIGLEVHATAYAFNVPGALGNTTFYRYRMFYRGTTPLTNAYVGFWNDADLGNASDDYVGSDTTLGMGFTYNADNIDEGSDGYGNAPPALGTNFLQGPLVDAPGQTWTDTDGTQHLDRKRLGTSVFLYYNNDSSPFGNPRANSTDWYNYLQGIWKDGNPLVDCGNGYGPQNTNLACQTNQKQTSFMWPGDPVSGAFWSEVNRDSTGTANLPSDRRYIQSTGPFEFAPGAEQTIQLGIVWSRGSSNLNSVAKLREDMRVVVSAFDANFDAAPQFVLPQGVPSLVTPVAGAVVASGNVEFVATTPSVEDRVEVQVAREAFADTSRIYSNGALVALEPGTYLARVRYAAGLERGPWSDPTAFSVSDVALMPYDSGRLVSFEVTANAAGPVVPVHPAAAAFQGFPTPDLDGDGVGDNPTDAQQVGPARWLIYVGGGFGDYDSFLSRAITSRGRTEADLAGRTFEIRFTSAGSVGYRRFQDQAAIAVPFEIWSTPTDTPGDPSDDVKLIPVILDYDPAANAGSGGGGMDGVYNLSTLDSPVSSSDNDPFTDWLYFFDPLDATPGTAGYDAYANGGSLDLTKVGEETLGRIVLVNWNGGGPPLPIEQPLPEQGTVFRIVVSGESAIDTPVLLSPSDASAFDAAPRFYWAEPDGIDGKVEIAADRGFRSPVPFTAVYGGGGSESSATIDAIDAGSYFWRVVLVSQQGDSVRSDVRTFSVSRTITADEVEAAPQSLTLLSPSPHPVSGPARLRFYLPASGEVRMEAYDLMGRRVAILTDGAHPQGWREAAWPSGLSAGVYLVRIRAGSETQTRQVVVVR